MIVTVPIFNVYACNSDDGISFTWGELGNNPLNPRGSKDMPIVNRHEFYKLDNGKYLVIHTEKTKNPIHIHLKILSMYEHLFDPEMKTEYPTLNIISRFKMWVRHVDDAWKQKGNTYNGNSIWDVNLWNEYADDIMPTLFEHREMYKSIDNPKD